MMIRNWLDNISFRPPGSSANFAIEPAEIRLNSSQTDISYFFFSFNFLLNNKRVLKLKIIKKVRLNNRTKKGQKSFFFMHYAFYP